jgi:glyoxylase-like metal-dependent hydrolase (beta-lactamase superfamily II)
LVIDPGPADDSHIEAILRESMPVRAIPLTHHHTDHAAAAPRLAHATGAPIQAFTPRGGEQQLASGQRIEAGGVVLRPMRSPGHSADHVVFHEPESAALFTGDAVLGRGTSVVDPPDGDMADYLRSLEAMLALQPRVLYPGHGPIVERAVEKLREYIDHRRMRERQVIDALARAGAPRSPSEMVPEIYAAYPSELHEAAARSLLAHLIKLEREGKVVRIDDTERFVLHREGPSAS